MTPPVMNDRRPLHHPDAEVLLDFASGAAHEAGAVIIATHLALCPQCRDTVKKFESLGGALIEDLAPSALAPGSRDAVMAQLDELPPNRGSSRRDALIASGTHTDLRIPPPLRDYIGADLNALTWRRIGPTVEQIEIPLGGANAAIKERIRLLRAKAGSAIQRHTHRGTEMTLVLSGGFRDRSQQYLRGDFALVDQQIDHSPRVDTDGPCICLSVTDAPIRFTGPFGRILNLFVRF